MKVWVNGELIDTDDSRVGAFDHGLTVGDGVFETIAVRDGRPLAVTRHLARLVRSAVALGLPAPDTGSLRTAVDEVTTAADVTDVVLRVVYTSGSGPLGSDRGDSSPTAAVLLGPAPERPPSTDVVTVPWPRNERGALVGVKTTSYAENVLALSEARRQCASEAIFANTAGNLCEGSGSNVFLVLDGRLMTPPLSAGCLAGVTRALVIERCGLDVAERDVPMTALAAAEEAFLTSATRNVQAIRRVDGRGLPRCPGPRTEEAAAAYTALQQTDPDPS
ncbi:MAG: 4-amino-4-deoxychorismate lyase [Actinobacteria bacterium]|nr:MAG: 4-amino-4-deoxychorismate lyase [Actinomycetota bacterium]